MRTLFAIAAALVAAVAAAAEPIPLGPLNLVPAPYAQSPFDLASNSDDFLTVWSDGRSTLDLSQQPIFARALYDARLNAVGTPLNPVGRRLRSFAYFAKLAPRGSGYLLAYRDGNGMFSVQLDADGAEIAAPKKLTDALALAGPLALATNGTNFLLLQNSAVMVLGPDGSLVRSTPITGILDNSAVWALPNGAYQFVTFRLDCSGQCAGLVELQTVSSAGDATPTPLFEIPAQSQVAAAHGNGSIVVASHSDDSAGSSVEVRLFDLSGHALRSAARLATLPAGSTHVKPAAGWDGAEFLVVYGWSDLRAVRVTSTGVLLDTTPVVLDPAGGQPPIFATNAAGLTTLVWSSGNVLSADAVSRTLRSFDELAATPTRIVVKAFDVERNVQVADGPRGTLAVWREGYPNPSLMMSVGGRQATTLAPAGAAELQAPAAARGRNAFLVAWREQDVDPFGRPTTFRVFARRVSFDGAPLDAAPIVVVAGETASLFMLTAAPLSIASDGTDWLVVYPGENTTVRAARVSAAGALLDAAPIVLTTAPSHFDIPAGPRVVWSGSRYVAVWAENPINPAILAPIPPVVNLYEARITAAGQHLDTKEIWRGTSAFGAALAAAPARLLLAWTDLTTLYTMVLGDDGTPLTTAMPLATAPSFSLPNVDAAWDGSAFAVAWTLHPTFDDARIEVQHVDANGAPLEAAPVELAPELGTKYSPSLTATPFGVTVAFHTLVDTGVARAFVTTLPRAGVPLRRRATR